MASTVPGARQPQIKVAIFDIDDTLYDCLHQRVEVAHRHAAEAIVRAGLKASVDTVLAVRMKAFAIDPQLKHVDAEVVKAFSVAEGSSMMRAAREAYFACPVGELSLFPGTLPTLRELK